MVGALIVLWEEWCIAVFLYILYVFFFFFFFQAEDGIRDRDVTGVQTCALPICSLFPGKARAPSVKPLVRFGLRLRRYGFAARPERPTVALWQKIGANPTRQIGRASCRERV